MIKKSIILIGIIAMIISCGKTDSNKYVDSTDCSTVNAADNTYNLGVKAIIDGSCAYAGCHDSGSKAGGVVLDSYAKAKSEFVDGQALCTIYHDCRPMPEGGSKLDAATIKQLTCWVGSGALQ